MAALGRTAITSAIALQRSIADQEEKTTMATLGTMKKHLAMCLLIALVTSVGPRLAGAAGASGCTLDQQMWINGGGDGFGNTGVLGQTFAPLAAGLVCKIEVMVHKNDLAAGNLQVTLRRHDFTPIPHGAVTIPAAEIPLGLSVQTIDFCCNQMPLLAGSPFYGLTLASPTSNNPAAYTWINSDDAGADAAYPRGRGYGNNNGAAPGTRWVAAGYDYAFKIYLCRP
jgi:hypothetical protein